MKSLLLPLCCFLVLGPRLRGALADETNTTADAQSDMTGSYSSTTSLTPGSSPPEASTTPTTPATTPTTPATTTTTTSRPVTKGPFHFLSTSEGRPAALVVGGLILACAILLLSTLMLSCRVCRLSRRLRTLSGSFDPVGSTENCVLSGKQAAGTAEAKETTVLLSDMGRTQEELANGAPKEEEGGRAKAEGGGAGGEAAPAGEKKQEEQEAPAAAASRPEEDATGSRSDVAAASSAEAAEEPKDVV